MDRSTFESADPILDEMGAMLDELLDSDRFAALRLALARLSEAVGPRYSVNLNVSVDVFDAERSNALPLLTLGLSTSQGKSPYKIYGELNAPEIRGRWRDPSRPSRPLSQMLRCLGLQARSHVLLGLRSDYGSRSQTAPRRRCLSIL